jgi:APA family basic amino acid/polyamine antiporter
MTFKKLTRKKNTDEVILEVESEIPDHRLKRTLGVWSLVAIGIGCVIGTGIFVLTGKVAISNAGPGLIISVIICGVVCILAALCYAEFASFIPISGSAYTYSYTTLGEFVAWIIGWDLILEYGIATAAVAIGWSAYAVKFIKIVGLGILPVEWTSSPFESTPGYINLPAVIIVLFITWLLIRGIKESTRLNNTIVVIKISVALFFIIIGFFYVKSAYWTPIIPHYIPQPVTTETNYEQLELWKWIAGLFGDTPGSGFGGWAGIFLGAAVIFFAYIGFDAVSTTSEEAINPRKDVPKAIILSLLICSVLYILMAAVFTGIVKCDGTLQLNELSAADKGAPMVYAFNQVPNMFVKKYAALIITIGALCGITSVCLVNLLGQSRVFFSISRDNLLPGWISKIHPKYKTPYIGTLITGIFIALLAGFIPLQVVAEMGSIGTLFAFILVAGGIIFLRKYQPEKRAAFRIPFVPYLPILSILCSIVLMVSLPVMTWIRFFGWMILGLIIYFTYGIKKSKLN